MFLAEKPRINRKPSEVVTEPTEPETNLKATPSPPKTGANPRTEATCDRRTEGRETQPPTDPDPAVAPKPGWPRPPWRIAIAVSLFGRLVAGGFHHLPRLCTEPLGLYGREFAITPAR